MMPNGDPRDGFFYPTLTLMIDSYSVICIYICLIHCHCGILNVGTRTK